MKHSRFWLYLVPGLLVIASHLGSAAEESQGTRIQLSGKMAPGMPDRVSIAQIESIGLHKATVFNPYEKRTEPYSGVWLDQFVSHFAQSGVSRVTLKAIDDYQVDFTRQEWEGIRILLVTRVNGKHIGFAQKGPMRIVFPDYDASQEIYRLEMPKWMWMITKIEFK